MHQLTKGSPLEIFVRKLSNLVDSEYEEKRLLPHAIEAMQQLVAEDNWLDPAFTKPHPQYYQQYLLYADPDDRFSIVSFVWGPGQQTPIHDHTVWGVIGMLRGVEYAQSYEIDPNGKPIAVSSEEKLLPGSVGAVSPQIGDVHRVRNAFEDRVSISIHAYGGNIGKINRHVFPVDGGPRKDFISGYSNAAS